MCAAAVAVALLVVGVLAPSPVAAQQRRVVVVGDSVILGAKAPITSSLAGAGWAVTFDAAVSRSTAAGLAAIESHRSELTDSLVVSLGANDAGNTASFRQKVEAILDATANVPHVYWVTIREVRDYYGPANQAVREVAAGRPNVTVVDWHAATAGATNLTASDGLHLNAAGASRMAQVVTDAVVLGALPASAVPAPPPPAPQPTAAPPTPPPPVEPPPTAAPETTAVTTAPPAATEPAATAPGLTVIGSSSGGVRADERAAEQRTVARSSGAVRDPDEHPSGLLVAARVAGIATGSSLLALVLGGLMVAAVAVRGSGAAPPPVQSPTHPAVRARRRAERIAAASTGTQES